MKRIKIPEDVTIVNFRGEAVIGPRGEVAVLSFSDFVVGAQGKVEGRLDDGGHFGAWKSVAAAQRIAAALLGAEKAGGGVVDLESADWELLKASVEQPSQGYNPKVAHSVEPFRDAINAAEDFAPSKD